MYKFNKLGLAVAAVLPLALVGVAHAASDGAVATDGAASEGESVIGITKTISVQIVNLDDLDLGTYPSVAADVTETDDVCVFASDTSYRVTVTSTAGAFEMQGVGGNTLPYEITWGAEALTYGAQSTVQSGTTDSACPTDNAAYTVTVTQADFTAASYDVYSDTLTISVVPE